MSPSSLSSLVRVTRSESIGIALSELSNWRVTLQALGLPPPGESSFLGS